MMRKFVIYLVFVVLALTSVGQAALVSHWTFDEADGLALDSSGNGYHGTIVGTVTQGQTGRIGGAYLFAGAGWVDFGVDTITTQITDFPISISYWIQSTAAAGTECAVWMGKRGADSQYLQTGMKFGNANAAYRNTDFDNAVAWKDNGTTATEADGDWHHIVAVYPDAGVRHVYVDGVLADSTTLIQPYFTEKNQVAVGNNNRRSSLTDPFDGLIDDVRIYDHVLSGAEILELASVQIQTISQIQANNPGDNWNTPGTWQDDDTPDAVALAHFVSTMPLRAPVGTVLFNAVSLTVSDTLYLDNQSVTVGNLIIDNGTLHITGSCVLDGGIDLVGDMQIDFADEQASLTLISDVSGQGNVIVGANGSVRFQGDNHLFSGNWSINGQVEADTDGSLGSGNITVNSGGELGVNYGLITDASLTLMSGSTTELYQDLMVGALTIKGDSFSIGSYDSLYLYQLYDDGTFIQGGSGSGSITVGPIWGTVQESNGDTAVIEMVSNSDSFSVVLAQHPGGSVTVTIDPQMTIYGNDIQLSGTANPGDALNLSFNETNWHIPQTVSVQAVLDGQVEPEEIATMALIVEQDGVLIGVLKPLDIKINDAVPTGLTADLDHSGEVGVGDLALLASEWLKASGYNLTGDIKLQMDDFSVMAQHWGDAVRPDSLADYSSHAVNGNVILFNCGRSQVKISLCNSQMARIQLAPDKKYRDDHHPDYFMVQKYDWPQVDFTVSDEGSYIKIATGDMVIRAQKSPFRLQMYQSDNQTLLAKDADAEGIYWQDDRIGVNRVEGGGGGGKFGFGGGDHGNTGTLNKNSGFNQFTVTHGRVPVPFFMSTAGYGIFLNTVSKNTAFDAAGGFYTDDFLDYWFMAGPSFKSMLGNYSELTGRMNLFPKWAYGFMLSKYGNDNATQDEFSDWIQWLRNGGHPNDDDGGGWPIDCYVFDYGWRGAKWNPHRWDPTRYDDLAAMFAEADSLGFHVGLHNNRGTPEAHNGDFTNPAYAEEWWQAHRDPVIVPGYGDWFWPDEFDVVGDNLMANRSAKVVHEKWLELTTQQRPMFITRGGFAGHHFACAWSGDISNTITAMNQQIVNQQATGLSGYPWFSHDLGGFSTKPSDNLYIRWVAEFGSFCSIMRAHGHDGREPWLYSTNAQGILRKYLKLRYKLFPYIYTSAWQGTSEGIPMMRAMVLEYQDHPTAWAKQNQYFWGDWFLVAPALSENTTDVNVWIPPGVWYDYFNGTQYTGPAEITVPAALDEIPVFVKAGAIIPMGPEIRYADELPLNEITLDIYPALGAATYTLYEDDGITRDYMLNNAYALTQYDYNNSGSVVTVTIGAAEIKNPALFTPTLPRDYYCKLNHTASKPAGVKKNGGFLTEYDNETSLRNASEGWCYDNANSIVWGKVSDDGSGCTIEVQ
jgi:alpha-glucosidase (family GH31 glycosyl hydrolase)